MTCPKMMKSATNPTNHPTTDSILAKINDFAPQGAFLLIVDSDLYIDSAQQPVIIHNL